MSRIGKEPITVPSGVEVKVDGNYVSVKGPKGELSHTFSSLVTISQDADIVNVTRFDDERLSRSMHGLSRTLLNNMIVGVFSGFEKKLELVGVGYRAALKGSDLEMLLGYSHPVVVSAPEGIAFEVIGTDQIIVRGIDKQKVGQTAADIRKWRQPEPYKGKGIRYEGEYVRRKLGKAALSS